MIKGSDTGVALLGQPTTADVMMSGQRVRRGVKVWPVNVSMAKSELYGQLQQSEVMVHYPEMPEEWYRQLTAEQFMTKTVKGFAKGEWVKTRERNEALDTANYARAAAAHVGLDRLADHGWETIERQLYTKAEPEPPPRPRSSDDPPWACRPEQARGVRFRLRSPWLER